MTDTCLQSSHAMPLQPLLENVCFSPFAKCIQCVQTLKEGNLRFGIGWKITFWAPSFAHPIRIGLVVGFQRGAKARLVSMEWSGFQGAETPLSAVCAWSMGFRGERILPDHGGVGGSLEAPLTGDATAKRCTASRITRHNLTPNKVVADAMFVGQK